MPEEGDHCQQCEAGQYFRTRVGPGPVGEPALECDNCGDEVLLA